jgi:hypothetical protein
MSNKFTQKTRITVLQENFDYGFGRCEWCHKQMSFPKYIDKDNIGHDHLKDNAPEVDHIIPKSRGGTRDIGNAQVLCRECNRKKDDIISPEYGNGGYTDDDNKNENNNSYHYSNTGPPPDCCVIL